jgi:hypothetical protein
MNTLQSTLACALFALAAGSAHASQTVWRCAGNSYASQPCPEGRQLEPAAGPSTDEQRHAREVAERDRRLARQMVQERRERDHDLRLTMGNGLTGFVQPAPPDQARSKPASQRLKDKPKKPHAQQRERAPRADKAPRNPSVRPSAPPRMAAL